MKTNEEYVEEFRKLGGSEEILEDYDLDPKDLPEGHLTRGVDWPETKMELDPDSVETWLRTTLEAKDKECEERVREERERTIEWVRENESWDEWGKGHPYIFVNDLIEFLTPTKTDKQEV